MKIKIFALMATMLLLMGTTAIAQSDNTKKETTEGNIKGDVNGDGIVDVADIAAVIAVMHEQGTVKQQYYWYAGWTEPTELNIKTIISEQYPSANGSTTMNRAGKTATSIDGVIMDYNVARLYNTSANTNFYVVVPNGQGIYDQLGTKLHLDDAAFTIVGTFKNHTIYKSTYTSRTIMAIIK